MMDSSYKSLIFVKSGLYLRQAGLKSIQMLITDDLKMSSPDTLHLFKHRIRKYALNTDLISS